MYYVSKCNCGSITISCHFPLPIEEYSARKCDCDFCMARGLSYLSDVNGTIFFSSSNKMNQLTQGSGQAKFWQCAKCEDVIAVTHAYNSEIRGAVSKALFDDKYSLKPSICVSPKKLSASEKTNRWSSVWSTVISN